MEESSANPQGGSSNVGEGWSSVNKPSPVNPPPGGMCNEPGQSVNLPPPRYTPGTSDKLNYQELKEVINKLYTDTSPHNDSQGKSDNKKEDIKHQKGDNLKLNLTLGNSSCQQPDGKSPDIRYKEQKEVLHKLYMDTTPSHKDNNSTSHSHNKYIKHDSTVHVQDPLTSHYPLGQDKKQECGYPLHNIDKFMEKDNLCPFTYCQLTLCCNKAIFYHDMVQSSEPQQVTTISHDKCMVKDNLTDSVPEKENIKTDPDKVTNKKIINETMGDEVTFFYNLIIFL